MWCCLEVDPDLGAGGTVELVFEYPFGTLPLSTSDGPLDRPPKTGKIPLSGLAAVMGNAGLLGIGDAPFPPKPTAPALDDGGRKISPEKKDRIVLMDLMLTPLRKVGEEVLLGGACGRASTDVDGLRAREGELSADIPHREDESTRYDDGTASLAGHNLATDLEAGTARAWMPDNPSEEGVEMLDAGDCGTILVPVPVLLPDREEGQVTPENGGGLTGAWWSTITISSNPSSLSLSLSLLDSPADQLSREAALLPPLLFVL